MTVEPFGTTTFCDDIRFEVNGKLSLIGCCGTEIGFHDAAPGTLNTFAALVNIRIPIEKEYENFKVWAVLEEGGKSSELFSGTIGRPTEPPSANLDTSDVIGTIAIPIQWSGLVFNGPATIKVRGSIDDGPELRFGALRIVFPEGEQGEDA